MSSFLKHAVAGTVVVTASVGVVCVVYFALLLFAIVTNAPVGSPVALPLSALFVLIASAGAVVLILLPVTVVTEVVCGRARRWRRLRQIPFATLLLLAYIAAAAFAIVRYEGAATGDAAPLIGVATVTLLLQLGLYWWSLQATDWLLAMSALLWRRLRPRRVTL